MAIAEEIRIAKILEKQGKPAKAIEALRLFLDQGELKLKHLFAAARTAALILKNQPESGDEFSLGVQQLGLEALERAEMEFEGSPAEFQSLLRDDELSQFLWDRRTCSS